MTHTHLLDPDGGAAFVDTDGELVDRFGDSTDALEVVCDDLLCPQAELSPPADAEYVREYNNGWQASRQVGRTGRSSAAFESGRTSTAWDDGYHDYAADRPKWHMAHCTRHDDCP